MTLIVAAAIGAGLLSGSAVPAASFARATPGTVASTPGCGTSGLVVWLNTKGDHAAGSTYYKLELTNLSGRACTLRGYPGVSGVNLAGRRLGSPAARNPTHPARLVTLASGASATAVLQVVDAHNFPRAVCRPATAAGLRVYPPGQTASKLVPFPFLACGRSGPLYLHVEAVQRAG